MLPEHLPLIWRAMEEAYVPEGGPPPTGEIPEETRASPTFQPELWQVAWEVSSGKVVGSVMAYINHAENKQLGILRGYTEGISTVPAWQRRGVARALIARDHADFGSGHFICLNDLNRYRWAYVEDALGSERVNRRHDCASHLGSASGPATGAQW
mgnify:CR=1 FL=1